MMPTRLLLPLLLLTGCAPVPQASAESFGFLEVRPSSIVTRHALPLSVSVDGAFRPTPASNRTARFGEHPFEVSLAAMVGRDEAVMVHAERVADASGASYYDDLPRAGWPDERFALRSMCAPIDRATVAEEHDLAFLDRNGFNPEGHLAIEQYLASTADHNQEVVISLVVRVTDCADAASVQAALRSLRDRVTVRPG